MHITEKEGKEGFSCKRRTKKDTLKKQRKKKERRTRAGPVQYRIVRSIFCKVNYVEGLKIGETIAKTLKISIVMEPELEPVGKL